MLEANISTQLKGYLANLQHEIVLASSLDNSAKSVELAELLNEIASMSSLVTLIQKMIAEIGRAHV